MLANIKSSHSRHSYMGKASLSPHTSNFAQRPVSRVLISEKDRFRILTIKIMRYMLNRVSGVFE